MLADIEVYQLGVMFGMNSQQVNQALAYYNKVREDPSWSNTRLDKSLLIDCLYIVGKKNRTGITVKKVIRITTDMFGYGIKPNPNKWHTTYRHLLV